MTHPAFNTITGQDWQRGLAFARARRKTAPIRITMQAFLSRLRELVPGVTVTVVADVGAGPVDVITIPPERVPAEVTVRAEWQSRAGGHRLAEFPMARQALKTGPAFFARSVADRLAPLVKGGQS